MSNLAPKKDSNQFTCKHGTCCDRPAPINYAHAQHERGKMAEGEEIWWTECYNCGYICKCEV